jgi:RNA polymerase sigma-70 factor (ECF subfamily)
VAANCLRNAERAARRQRRVAAKVATMEPRALPPDPAGDLDLSQALGRMRAEDAELLRLWAWEQLTPTEIATVLDITANAASIRLHRARERLRAELRKIERVSGHEGSREGRTS